MITKKFKANTIAAAVKQLNDWMPRYARIDWFSISCKPGEGCVIYVHIR